MSTHDEQAEATPPRMSKRGFLIGLVLALLAGGGAFFAVYSGMILSAHDAKGHDEAADETMHDAPLPDVAFVPTGAIVVPVGEGGSGRFLHFAASIEVPKEAEADVTHLLPRITDVLNTYLRAVEVSDLDRTTALARLRAQMLRRVQIVLGDGSARDLLITEFVIN